MSTHTATMKPSFLARIAGSLTDDQLVRNLNSLNETLDSFAANTEQDGRSVQGIDPDAEPTFRRDLALRDALRAEYRTRTGEVI